MGSARADRCQDVVVLAGGEPVDPAYVPPLPSGATVIAADGGLAWAARLGLRTDVVVGDLDSVDHGELAAAEATGARVDRHPVDKDRTDLAIALDTASELGARRVVVVGGHGGRLDHHLANLLLLGSPVYAHLDIVAHMGTATVTVVRDMAVLAGAPGETLSLLPVHGTAHDVSTEGLRFALHGEDLTPGSSRGVSNEFTDASATVKIGGGVLLAIRPGCPT